MSSVELEQTTPIFATSVLTTRPQELEIIDSNHIDATYFTISIN